MVFLIAVLLLILLIFGISSAMNSYAAAQNAASVIAVAHVAEINATGNLIVILVLALAILTVLGLSVAAVIWLAMRNKSQAQPQPRRGQQMRISSPSGAQPMPEFSISDLIQLETLRALRSLSAPQYPQLTAPREDTDNEAEMVELSWLSRR